MNFIINKKGERFVVGKIKPLDEKSFSTHREIINNDKYTSPRWIDLLKRIIMK